MGGSVSAATEVITDLLERGHAVRFCASGDSMYPIIRSDDYLHVEPRLPIRRGDVVLTLAHRGLTAHRVIEIEGDTLVTRGDNARENDAPVDRTRVLGHVTYAERDGKSLRVRRATSLMLALQRVIVRAVLSGARRKNGAAGRT